MNILIILILLLSVNAYASPPTRQAIYTPNAVISSSDVSSNENVIFNYLQAGVDTYADGTIVNADINSSANIQSDKLNLTSVNQNIQNTGTFSNTGNATITGTLTVSSTVTANSVTFATLPAGVVMAWTTDTAPSGWLLCDGSAVSRTTYSGLFAVISTTYGVGDGSTTFNVPDLRGRFILGQDDMGGSSANRVTDTDADTLGNADGTETKTLTSTELPAHTHTIGAGQNYNSSGNVSGTGPNSTDYTFATSSTGSGAAYSQMNPYMTLNYIIKF